MSNNPNATNTGGVMSARQLVCKIMDCTSASPCEGFYTKWADADKIVEQYSTALLAPHLAKIKRLEEALRPMSSWYLDACATGSRPLKGNEYPGGYGMPNMGQLKTVHKVLYETTPDNAQAKED